MLQQLIKLVDLPVYTFIFSQLKPNIMKIKSILQLMPARSLVLSGVSWQYLCVG